VGRALLDEAVAWARRHRVRKLHLEVFSSNTRAIALYRSFGFVEDGVNRRHHKVKGRYVDNIHMALWV
jgi:RimJ/RimL family protein N-acetyltransferase